MNRKPSHNRRRPPSGPAALLVALSLLQPGAALSAEWTAPEVDLLRSLWIVALGPPPPDPTNAVADDPDAAAMGHRLFFDTRLSRDGNIACATCHRPELRFADGLPKGVAIGMTKRNTPGIIGAAYSPWLYWDGRRDSLWSQALSPLEDPNEHGGNRMQYVHIIANDPGYRRSYEALFGALPDLSDAGRFPEDASPLGNDTWAENWRQMTDEDREAVNRVFTNTAKAVAAYERLLLPAPSRFDEYVAAVTEENEEQKNAIFSDAEVAGLRLFLGGGNCTQCHNGPLLTNFEFHNTGVISAPGDVPDKGRIVGVDQVRADPFNCLGDYSDAAIENCAELRFVRAGTELIGAMRTPSLRNLENTGPYMHQGQLETLADVLAHYNAAPEAMIGHSDIEPLGLSDRELEQLEAFLLTLAAPAATSERWLNPPAADTPHPHGD